MYNKLVTRNPVSHALQLFCFVLFFLFFFWRGGGELGGKGDREFGIYSRLGTHKRVGAYSMSALTQGWALI